MLIREKYILKHNALHKFECKMFNYEVNTGNANSKLHPIKMYKECVFKGESGLFASVSCLKRKELINTELLL